MADSNRPDPDEVNRKLSEIFREAAARSTGEAQVKFKRLSNSFDEYVRSAESGSSLRYERARTAFRTAMDDVTSYARTNDEAARILLDMSRAIMKVSEGYDEKPPAQNDKNNDNGQKNEPGKKKPGRHYRL